MTYSICMQINANQADEWTTVIENHSNKHSQYANKCKPVAENEWTTVIENTMYLLLLTCVTVGWNTESYVNFRLLNSTVRSNPLLSTTILPHSLVSLGVRGRIRTPTRTCDEQQVVAVCFIVCMCAKIIMKFCYCCESPTCDLTPYVWLLLNREVSSSSSTNLQSPQSNQTTYEATTWLASHLNLNNKYIFVTVCCTLLQLLCLFWDSGVRYIARKSEFDRTWPRTMRHSHEAHTSYAVNGEMNKQLWKTSNSSAFDVQTCIEHQ